MRRKRTKKPVVSAAAFLLGSILLFAMCPGIWKLFTSASQTAAAETPGMELWYDEPATEGKLLSFPSTGVNVSGEFDRWQQTTLPLGNGAIGATVYGEIQKERIVFNEKTLWKGGPSESRPDYNGGNKTGIVYDGRTMAELYREIQRLFLAGDGAAASRLCDKLVGAKSGEGYGSYQAWGDIYLDFGAFGEVSDYRRGLDLETGTAYVSFRADGANYKREYFVSSPDDVLAVRLTCDRELSVGVEFVSAQGAKASVQDGVLTLAGRLADNGLIYHSQIRVAEGRAKGTGEHLTVEGKEIVLVAAAATDYRSEYPAYRTGETAEEVGARVSAVAGGAAAKGYAALREAHEADYKELYTRLTLDLGQETPNMTTDELLAKYKAGKTTAGEERYLEVLLYQYGRYLTIASSREGNQLPSNLQGLWNPVNNPPWSSDYHMNVNLQMNYWPTYAGNLAECALPLIRYVDGLREPGRVTAAVYTGVESGAGEENGFTAHTQNTPFGWTCPGWEFNWGWSPAAVPWILQNVYEYYEYTQDKEYLESVIYPMMREETAYFERILIEDPATGRKLTAPAYSPEHGPRTMGNTYEQSLVWQLYEDTIAAAERLGKDAEKVKEWKATQAALDPIEIGQSGQIKEWYDETTFGRNESGKIPGYQGTHRHMSHLLGLFPGDLINADENAENGWLDAAIVSLNERGDKSTGWAMGQRINAWARTGDGDHAYALVRELFKNGIYPNLFDAHPPFQLDGNFGYTAGVNEMLMQSHLGYIRLLPALPSAWPEGRVSGMVARGNFELDFSWRQGGLTDVKILSRSGGVCTLQYPNISAATLVDGDGNPLETTKINDDKISFETDRGETIRLIGIPQTMPEVKGTEACRLDDEETLLRWSAVNAAEGYRIYRKTGTGDWTPIAETDDTRYVDYAFQAKDYAGTQWAVTARVGGGESPQKSVFPSAVDLREVSGFLNDDHAIFEYSGGWKSESFAISYEGDVHWAIGEATVKFKFCGDGFTAYARKHVVFELCDVVVDGRTIKRTVAGYHNGDEGKAELVTVEGLEYGYHEAELRFYADADNPNRKRADFDGVTIRRDNPARKYAVSFAAGGAAGEQPYFGKIPAGMSFLLPDCGFTREGFFFSGWQEGETVYQPGGSYQMPEREVTFTAVWKNSGAPYLVEHAFEGLDGKFVVDPSKTQTKYGKPGESTRAEAWDEKEIPGFTAQTEEQKTIAADGTTVVTIRYVRGSYTLTFKNGDEVFGTPVQVKYGERISLPSAAPEKAADAIYAYAFAGWKNYAEGMTMPASDLTLTAEFKSEYIEYTVVFKDYDGRALDSRVYHYGEEVEAPAAPSRLGYLFAGWTPEVEKTVCKDAEYTAVYEAETSREDSQSASSPKKSGCKSNLTKINGGAAVVAGSLFALVAALKKRRS